MKIVNEQESEILTDEKIITRKHFISLTGKSLIGTAVSTSMVSDLLAQEKLKATSPPAKIPPAQDAPIELEAWKSDVDQASAPLPTPLAPKDRVGYAVVGLGHLALGEILPALSSCKKSKLVALVSGSPEKLEKVGKQYGISPENCYNYETYDTLIDNPEVDVIYIVLPNGLHHEYVIRGAKAGKHMLCEKPMANSSQECRDMITACNEAGVKLMIAYRIQYQPHNRTLRELIQKKEFGIPKLIETSNNQSSANPNHWRHKKSLAGGGALPDIGIYCLNTLRFILQEEPSEVFGYVYSTPGNPLFAEVEELVSWQMRFSNGLIANCATHYNVHESRQLRVLCEKGWYNIDKAYAYKGQQMQKAYAEGKIGYQDQLFISEINQFAAEMDHFSDCVLNNKKPFTAGEEGLQDHIIMEAIYESAHSGKPVKISSQPSFAELHGPEPILD